MATADDPLLQMWERLENGPRGHLETTATAGNRRLTALAGVLLLPLLSAVYATGLVFGGFRSEHFFIGFLLTAPLLLKLASTGWRASRYYGRSAVYREAGPPWIVPRLLAVPLVLLALLAMVSGIVLWALGTDRGIWSTLHTDSVVLLVPILGLHLLIHLRRSLRVAATDRRMPATAWRRGAAVFAVTLGLGVALAAIPLQPPWHETPRFHGSERG